MKTSLHTALLLATTLCTGAARAQDAPPPPPPRPDAPPLERESPPPEGHLRRAPGPGDSAPRSIPPLRLPTTQRLRPYLGVVTSPAPAAVAAQAGLPEGFGLVVDEVLPESPAKAAGLERYDVLTKFDDQKLVDPAQLAVLVGAATKDADVTLTLLRRGQERKLTVKVGEKMLPDRSSARGTLPDLREVWRRYGEEGAPFRERMEDAGRRAQEMGRDVQRRMQEFQEKVEQWRKNPGEKFPEPPKFPGTEPSQPPPPRQGEARPERRSTTIRNTAQANISIKDDDGEIEVRSENGRRTLVARDKSGATVFDGAIDTEDQRRALPESVRRKLERVEARTHTAHPQQQQQPPPPPSRGGDVQ